MDATETLSGAYGTARILLPDGSEVPVLARKVPRGDGSFGWAVIDDRAMAYEAACAHTDFAAHDLLQPDTEPLARKVETISTDSTTQRHISGDLIQFLGDPDRILAQKGLDPERLAHLKQHPSSATLARRLCAVAGGKWLQVLQYVPKFYPDSRPQGA